MIDYDLLIEWLNAVPTELGHQFILGPRQPEFQLDDRVGLVTPQQGPGLALDGLANVSSFDLKLTAREHQHMPLRRTAFSLDAALLWGPTRGSIWGTQVQWVDRTGGEPGSIPEDNLDRVAYLCSYIVHEMPEI